MLWFLCVLFLGCDTFSISKKSTVWLERIDINASKDANGGAPIKLHIVFIYDDNALKVIGEKTNADYFSGIDQIKSDFREKIEIFEFDVIPGKSVSKIPINPSQYAAKSAIVFARYTSNDQNQKKPLADEEEVRFEFKKDTYEIIKIQ